MLGVPCRPSRAWTSRRRRLKTGKEGEIGLRTFAVKAAEERMTTPLLRKSTENGLRLRLSDPSSSAPGGRAGRVARLWGRGRCRSHVVVEEDGHFHALAVFDGRGFAFGGSIRGGLVGRRKQHELLAIQGSGLRRLGGSGLADRQAFCSGAGGLRRLVLRLGFGGYRWLDAAEDIEFVPQLADALRDGMDIRRLTGNGGHAAGKCKNAKKCET